MTTLKEGNYILDYIFLLTLYGVVSYHTIRLFVAWARTQKPKMKAGRKRAKKTAQKGKG